MDTAERYPWRFPSAPVERRTLAAGDYALLDGERVAALVERKSFENLLTEVGAIQALHQQLADLASHEAAALVIEADYRDFLRALALDRHFLVAGFELVPSPPQAAWAGTPIHPG